MNNQEETNSLTKEKDNIEKEKEINEQDPLNTFEIIQFESNRPKPPSRNKCTTILFFVFFIILIIIVTLYFLNKSDKIFNEDVKLFKLKIRKGKKADENEVKKKDDDDIKKKAKKNKKEENDAEIKKLKKKLAKLKKEKKRIEAKKEKKKKKKAKKKKEKVKKELDFEEKLNNLKYEKEKEEQINKVNNIFDQTHKNESFLSTGNFIKNTTQIKKTIEIIKPQPQIKNSTLEKSEIPKAINNKTKEMKLGEKQIKTEKKIEKKQIPKESIKENKKV